MPSKPAMFINVNLFLGGLHLLMSCIDFIVTLIGETGLAEVLKSFISCFFENDDGHKVFTECQRLENNSRRAPLIYVWKASDEICSQS
jgi:hypothetical protein